MSEMINTFVGACIGGAIALIATFISNKSVKEIARQQQRSQLVGYLLQLTQFQMEYPYVETREFFSAYPNLPGDAEMRERYENYCVYLFNVLQEWFTFLNGDEAKMVEEVHVDEIIRNHHKWWAEDRDNLQYEASFRKFIFSVSERLKKEGKI